MIQSANHISAIKHVLRGAKDRLIQWKELSQHQRCTEIVKAFCLCRMIALQPEWFSEDNITDEHIEMAMKAKFLLRRVMDERFCASEQDVEQFWGRTIPFMLDRAIQCAQDINEIMSERLTQLETEGSKVVMKSRWQCAEIVAGGFFGLFPRASRRDGPERPSFDFLAVHQVHHNPCSFVLCYFSQVAKEDVKELQAEHISFTRKAASPAAIESLFDTKTELCDVQFDDTGSIEDYEGLHADFANKFIGGGVLVGGNVQEEIRFMICPELLVSMPLSDVMLPHEAIEIVGALQYGKYSGYGGSLQYGGATDLDAEKRRWPLDAQGRRAVRIVAFDALPMPGPEIQYGWRGMSRELLKATVAFAANAADASPQATTAPGPEQLGLVTGNWGCGVFGGDPQLKALLQWLACSVARRPRMVYCAFKDKRVDGLQAVVKAVRDQGWRVCDLYRALSSEAFSNALLAPQSRGVFQFLLSQLAGAGGGS